MTQQRTFDFAAAALARDEAIDRVEAHTELNWADAALDAVRLTALALDSFIVDEVWVRISPDCGEEPHEPRAMGAVMRRARIAGWVEPTDDFQPSARVTAHRNPRRIWRSRLRGVT